MHAALGECRRALDGQLFGYAALAPKTRLQAEIRCYGPEFETLLALLKSTPSVRVGHARSAGYGLVNCTVTTSACTEQKTKAKKHILFLHSPYVPLYSWLTPLESLQQELTLLGGELVKFTSIFVSHDVIQRFNSLWKKPRTARNVLAQGSVLVIETENPVSLAAHLTLGADRREGYGRLECNPGWLASSVLRPKVIATPQSEVPPSQPAMSPMLAVLRRHSLDRLDTDWLATKDWRKFLKSVSGTQIRQSQRGNIRHMVMETPPDTWRPRFLEAMGKTPGTQWNQAEAWSPMTRRKKNMDALMADILDRKTVLETMQHQPPLLPGGKAQQSEMERFSTTAHRLFVLELLRAWEKSSRTNTKQEND